MYYEQFLFTRNTRRDFTAFIRPEETTNADVSAIAGMIGYINDVSWLTPEHPALYCFPLGAYTYLLRYYDSGRRHAGRPIGVLEGVAVNRTQTRTFAGNIHTFIRLQRDYLDVVGQIGDVEALQPSTSERHNLLITRVAPPTPPQQERQTVGVFAASQAEARLVVPFTEIGLNLLVSVLTSPNIPPLIRFAFGTNSDVVRRLASMAVDLDIVGMFGQAQPVLRRRDNNDLVETFTDYPLKPFEPPKPQNTSIRDEAIAIRQEMERSNDESVTAAAEADEVKTPFDYGPEQRGVLTPREMRRRAREMAAANTPIESEEDAIAAEAYLFEGEVLTPRQMRRRALELEASQAADDGDEVSKNWLVALIRRLFGGR